MTTTPIEGFPASQEEYSEWSEKYTPPTAVGEPWTQTINASELDAGSDLVMPDTTTAPDGAAAVLNSKGVSDMAKAEAARLKEIQDDLVEAEEEKRPWVDKLTGKKTSKADTLAAQQTKYDISGKLDQLSSITNLTLPLQTQMADLEARQQREIDRNDERLASSVAKDREANAIDLRYAKLQAPLAAKLNAYAAQAQAVQGNLSIANQFISQAVNAAVYDQEFEYNRTKDIMDANQDYIDGLEDDEKEILNNIQNLKLDEFNNAKVEKTAIGQLIVKYNQYGAGITFDDTLEEAQIKAGSLSTDEAELLSVAEAKSLGVPYGTTQAQAIAMGITPGDGDGTTDKEKFLQAERYATESTDLGDDDLKKNLLRDSDLSVTEINSIIKSRRRVADTDLQEMAENYVAAKYNKSWRYSKEKELKKAKEGALESLKDIDTITYDGKRITFSSPDKDILIEAINALSDSEYIIQIKSQL